MVCDHNSIAINKLIENPSTHSILIYQLKLIIMYFLMDSIKKGEDLIKKYMNRKNNPISSIL